MSNWWYERWKENEWTPIFMPSKQGDGAHDDMMFASAIATKCFMDRMPWWKKLWFKIKFFFKEKVVKSLLRIVALTCLFVCGYGAVSQQPAAPQVTPPDAQTVTPKAPYDNTKAQLSVTKEENLQLKANAATNAYQQQMKDLQTEWQTEEASLTAWIAQVKKDNSWDDTYTYDRAGDKWTHTLKVETKSADTPKK